MMCYLSLACVQLGCCVFYETSHNLGAAPSTRLLKYPAYATAPDEHSTFRIEGSPESSDLLENKNSSACSANRRRTLSPCALFVSLCVFFSRQNSFFIFPHDANTHSCSR